MAIAKQRTMSAAKIKEQKMSKHKKSDPLFLYFED